MTIATVNIEPAGCLEPGCTAPIRTIRILDMKPGGVRASCSEHTGLAPDTGLELDFGARLYPERIGWRFIGGTQCESCGDPDDKSAAAIRAGDTWLHAPPPCRRCGRQLADRLHIQRPGTAPL